MTVEYTLPIQPRLMAGPTVGETASRPARIAMLVALAHRFDQLVRTGAVKDYAELARLGHITRARVTQIMNLLNLAPDIQEYLLWLPAGCGIPERDLRPIAAEVRWDRQQTLFLPHKEKPPRQSRRLERDVCRSGSGLDGIAARAVRILDRGDGKAELLANRSGEKPAN